MTDLEHDQHPEEEPSRAPDEGATAESDARPNDDADSHGREGAAGASEVAAQGSQDALFTTDLPPAVQPETDEGVTVFGEHDDTAAVREGLEGAQPPAEESPAGEVEPDAAAEWETLPPPEAVSPPAEVPETPAEAAEVPAETPVEPAPTPESAVVEAGLPAGADDDADAVEALLDAEAEAGLLERPDRTLSVPFLVYDGIWLVFAIAMVAVLRTPALAGTLDSTPAYPVFVLAGLVLTVAGPLLAVALWWIARSRVTPGERRGLFASAFLRGALATFAGVALWLVARVVLDFMRTGRLY